jgi:hypothetical protein
VAHGRWYPTLLILGGLLAPVNALDAPFVFDEHLTRRACGEFPVPDPARRARDQFEA